MYESPGFSLRPHLPLTTQSTPDSIPCSPSSVRLSQGTPITEKVYVVIRSCICLWLEQWATTWTFQSPVSGHSEGTTVLPLMAPEAEGGGVHLELVASKASHLFKS